MFTITLTGILSEIFLETLSFQSLKKIKEYLTDTPGCQNFVEFCRKFGHLYIPEERPVILFNRN